MSKKDAVPGTLNRGEGCADHDSVSGLKALLNEKSERCPVTEDHILSVLFVRRARAELIGRKLFSDPAWDLMLELYAARLGERTVCPADLALAIDTPISTTSRWITALNRRGLVETSGNPVEATVTQIQLSEEGFAKMQKLADRWVSAFVSI